MSRTVGGNPCCSRMVAADRAASRQWASFVRTIPRKVRSVSPRSSWLYGRDSSQRWTRSGVLAASMMRRSRDVNTDRGGAGLIEGGPVPGVNDDLSGEDVPRWEPVHPPPWDGEQDRIAELRGTFWGIRMRAATDGGNEGRQRVRTPRVRHRDFVSRPRKERRRRTANVA